MQSFIYVIGPATPPIKIGITKNCQRRLKNLQTGHSSVLQIHHAEQVDAAIAKTLESIIHKNLRLKKTQGEWFNISVEEAINEIKFAVIRWCDEPSLVQRHKSKLLPKN